MQSGFFFLDKPKGWSTFDLIRDLRKKTSQRKIGHTGTLDPFATGLVILCLNKATRLSNLLTLSDKEYVAEIVLGFKTDTKDTEGQIISEAPIPILNDKLVTEATRKTLLLTEQIPPAYSAVKIDGKPSYQYARKGEEKEHKARVIKVFSFDTISTLQDKIPCNSLIYRSKVSKGTYIRVLTEQFAEILGTIAYTKELRRVKVGTHSIKDAVTPEQITPDNWQNFLRPIHSVFADFPSVHITEKGSKAFVNGNRVLLSSALSASIIIKSTNNELFDIDYFSQASGLEALVYNRDNNTLGLGIIERGYLKPKLVFV